MANKISVIIVNYNSTEWTIKCIHSIMKHCNDTNFEIIVVDNASPKDNPDRITTDFPFVHFIPQKSNLGFAKACNLAAKYACGEFLLFLNPDTRLHNNALSYFLNFWIQNNKMLKISCLGSELIDAQKKSQHSFGNFPIVSKLIGSKFRSLFQHLIKKTYSSETLAINKTYPLAIDYITGAALFTSKKRFDEFEGFNEEFFMYFEETDMQKRMAKRGYQSYIIEGPIIEHEKGISTIGKNELLRVYYFNSLLAYIKNHNTNFVYLLFFFIWHVLDFKTVFQKIKLALA